MVLLGIDIGSSSIKGGLLDVACDPPAVRGVKAVPFPERIGDLPKSWFEVAPNAVVEAVRNLLESLTPPGCEPRGVFVSSQMGGVVLVDGNGEPVTNYLSWRDQRTLDSAAPDGEITLTELRQRTSDDDWTAIGRELKPGAAAALLHWLVRHRLLPPSATWAMSLGDYVVSKLCGSSPATHPTLALGLVDIPRSDWRHEWFERLGLGRLRWPRILPIDQPAGELNLAGRATPCFPPVGDHQAALYGAALVPDELSINVSTGSQVSLVTETFQPGDYQSRPFFQGQFLNTITHLPAGRSLSALVDLLCELPAAEDYQMRDPWSAIGRLVQQVERTDLQVDLAFFPSSAGDDGGLRNARLENLTVGHLFRAAFENMADNYHRCASKLAPRGGFSRIVLSGGLTQRVPTLRDAILSRFACDWRMVETTEETLLGLARLAQRTVEGSERTHDSSPSAR